jgi:hypothetical protein
MANPRFRLAPPSLFSVVFEKSADLRGYIQLPDGRTNRTPTSMLTEQTEEEKSNTKKSGLWNLEQPKHK